MHRAAKELPFLSPALPESVVIAQPAANVAALSNNTSRRWDWKTLSILLLITAVGGCFRFYRLTYPALWNDEALVFWRSCGTYGQMLQPLSRDGFPPLHYSLYWLIGHLDNTYWLPMTWPIGFLVVGIFGWLICLAIDPKWRGQVVPILCGIFSAAILLGAVWQFQLLNLLADSDGIWQQIYRLVHVLDLPAPDVHWIYLGRIVHPIKMTPLVMRIMPATFGVLTIPAIYFLSRQMFPKGTSLVAAAFIACSAFMLFYSRDAKMYPNLYLFVTLNVGCMLWWFRSGSSTAWLCWIAAGCAMVGLHASAFMVVVIAAVMFFTQRRIDWNKTIWFLLGMLIIASGPVVYATKFNHWTERVEREGWSDSGIGWVNGFFNGNRTGPDHALYTTSAFLIGYEWPRDDYLGPHAEQPISPPLLDIPQTAFEEVFWILMVGALPWPLMWRPRRDLDPPPEPPWRVYFWLGSWILVIGYIFYCRSVNEFESPWRWESELVEWLSVWGMVVLGALATGFLIVAALHRRMWPSILRFFQFIVVTVVLFCLCWMIFEACVPASEKAKMIGDPWQSIWTPRYLGIIWPAVGIVTAGLLMRLPGRALRISCIFFVLAVNLGMASLRMVLTTEPPIDLLAKDVYASQDAHATTRTFDFIEYGDLAVAGSNIGEHPGLGSGRYYLAMESNRPMSPELFVQSYYTYNLHSDKNFSSVTRSIKSSPQLTDVVFWSMLRSRQQLKFDPYRTALPQGWKLASERVYTVRVPWDWRERWRWVRREYVLARAK